MSVFTHGVNTKGKPRLVNRNQVFAVGKPRRGWGVLVFLLKAMFVFGACTAISDRLGGRKLLNRRL
jgi:hypothetical protein